MSQREIPGGGAAAVPLRAGEAIRLVNTFGSQVVDTWAVAAADPSAYLSVEHTRRMNGALFPKRGDPFWSNRRDPMLVLEEDTFPGKHDMLVACCDPWLYRHYGCQPGHANCHDNFLRALAGIGVQPDRVPNPVNLWMNVPVEGDAVSIAPPVGRPGDLVVLRAVMDVIVVFSACPMDIVPINGEDRTPKPVHYTVLPTA